MSLADGGYQIPRLPYVDPATALGISVAIAGNVLISLALNLQKLAHRRLELENASTGTPASSLDTPESRDNANQADNVLDVPSALDLVAEPNPWSRSYSSLHNLTTPARTPASEIESSSLVQNSGSPTYISYGAVTPVRERSPLGARSRQPRRRGSLAVLLDLETHAQPRLDERPEEQPQAQDTGKSYLHSKLWWAGFLLMNLGEVGNFISYGFAPASVVAPLGTFALIANCFFAPLIQHERFRKRDLLGVAVAIIGAITVVLSSQTSDTRLSPAQIIAAVSRLPFIVFSAIYVAGAFILASLSRQSVGQRYALIDVGLCALFGGFTVLATKGVSVLLTTRGILMFEEWITYPIIAVLVGTGVGQIHYLNRALMKFDSKIVIPTQFVLFNLSAIVGSGILYQDFRKTTFHQFVTFLYGCGATFAGVFIIASGSDAPQASHASERSAQSSSDQIVARVYAGEPGSMRKVHVIRPRESVVSLVGLSPAQGLLLVHTPQHEEAPTTPLHHGRDVERAGRVSQLRPEPSGRRRAISMNQAGRSAATGENGMSVSPESIRSDGT